MSIITKIKNRSKWLISYPRHWFFKTFYPTPKVKGIEETLQKIIKDRPSVSRYGDGELDIMVGKNIPFQKYEPLLAEKMKNILQTNEEDFLVCLANVFSDFSYLTEKSQKYFKNHMRTTRHLWYGLIDLKKDYFCAQITRPYIDFEDKSNAPIYFNSLKRVWQDRDIVIIEGEKSRLGIGNDLFDSAKSIKRILCPAKNAFSFYDDILNAVAKLDKDCMILLALGPTATALAYDIYKMGYQAVDIGHVDIEYEWF
ncbi:MAG: SP_1767 family glycosyltransferase, partial [Clostridia bacterium]|nr:SP_1767 family glycosyltransferase [Clostridia bacterium]